MVSRGRFTALAIIGFVVVRTGFAVTDLASSLRAESIEDGIDALSLSEDERIRRSLTEWVERLQQDLPEPIARALALRADHYHGMWAACREHVGADELVLVRSPGVYDLQRELAVTHLRALLYPREFVSFVELPPNWEELHRSVAKPSCLLEYGAGPRLQHARLALLDEEAGVFRLSRILSD